MDIHNSNSPVAGETVPIQEKDELSVSENNAPSAENPDTDNNVDLIVDDNMLREVMILSTI